MTLILQCSPWPKITPDNRKINTNFTQIHLDVPVCKQHSITLSKLNGPSRWSLHLLVPPQQIKATFQELMDALRSINQVQCLAPSSFASSYTRHTQPCKMARKKKKKEVKTERLNVKMGHSTLAAYLMHISPFRRHFFPHNCLQLKVNTRKSNFQSFYIKPRNAMPPVCCWAWTQKALFTIFFLSFSDSLVL